MPTIFLIVVHIHDAYLSLWLILVFVIHQRC